ncbi:uncharacterized protein LOC120420121 [Culex pipiens pallens]|uniref:uncharacterized protein LOC120420121 n=1 Tax=Culex pipiens pallens TaxID=42434 RepID=UPI001952EE17|nr:uncharacterized protein LOC120420121 [Culex pipiens pallens]
MSSFFVTTDKLRIYFLITLLILTSKLTSSEPCGTRHNSTWPWHVQLVDANPANRTVFCAGTLLSAQLVITAAHCLHDRNGDPIELDRLLVLLANGDLRPATNTFYPKPYDPKRLDHDVAMVALDRKVAFSNLVGPVCYADFGKFEDVRSPAFEGRSLEMQNEEACRQTTTKLFKMTYEKAICLGAFNESHQYNQKAGSGLVIDSGSTWILVGVLMYTTGQSADQIDYAGGVSIERYYKWIGRIINHFSDPDLVNKKCKQYTGGREAISNILYSVHVMDTQVNQLCHGVIVSPRFVVTIAECAKKTKRIMVYNGQSFKSQEVFAKAKVHYEEWNNKLALIDLGRNISSPGSVISCLWNGRVVQNFTKVLSLRGGSLAEQYVSHVQYRPGAPLQVRYRCPAHQQHSWNKTFGDLIGVKVAREQRPRIAGLLDGVPPCDTFDHFYNRQRTAEAISLQQYLPWIEDLVWRGGSG